MRKWLFLWFYFVPVLSQADIYSWTDANGTTHYSDTPAPNAKIIQLAPQQFSQTPSTVTAPGIASTTATSISPVASSIPEKSAVTAKKSSDSSILNMLEKHIMPQANPAVDKNLVEQKPIMMVPGYTEITIGQPVDQSTVRDGQGELNITITSNPALQTVTGDQLIYLLDNTVIDKPTNATSIKVVNVNRGEHKLQVKIQDKSGKILKESKIITFYMQRPTINKPKV